MNRKPSIRRSILLALMLLAGPLHAQTLFACAMLDVVLEECCCDESDRHDALEAKAEPCCEQSIELRFDPASDETSAGIKPIEVRSNVDPPPAAPLEPGAFDPAVRLAVIAPSRSFRTPPKPGPDLYLLTQRLRI